MEQPLALLFVPFGVFAIVCAIGNWDWFMSSRKAQRLSRLIGRNGARIFYSVLGLALIVLGVLIAFGILGSK